MKLLQRYTLAALILAAGTAAPFFPGEGVGEGVSFVMIGGEKAHNEDKERRSWIKGRTDIPGKDVPIVPSHSSASLRSMLPRGTVARAEEKRNFTSLSGGCV